MSWLKPFTPISGDTSPLALVLLCLHSASLLLLCRYSLGTIGESYSLPVLVLLIEVWKLVLTFAWLWISGASIKDLLLSIWTSRSPRWCFSGAFVAVLALFQFLSLKHLPALTFAVGVNLRLVFVLVFGTIFPPTATISSSALMSPVSASPSTATGVTVRKVRWSLMLILGVVILWHDPPIETGAVESLIPAYHPYASFAQTNGLGYLAMLLLTVLDGFARVYLDRSSHLDFTQRARGVVVAAPSPNGGGPNLWERNLRLAFWGSVMSALLVLVTEREAVKSIFFGSSPPPDNDDPSVLEETPHRLFSGFSLWSTGIVLLQSLGSLILAYAVRRTSEKGVALVSVWSVILVGLGSYLLLELHCTAEAFAGTGVVCVAMWSWSDEEVPVSQGELPFVGDLAENTALFAGHTNSRSADADFSLQELGRDGLDRSYDSPVRQLKSSSHPVLSSHFLTTAMMTSRSTRATNRTAPPATRHELSASYPRTSLSRRQTPLQ